MKAYSIVLESDKFSELGYKKLLNSSKIVKNSFKIERFNAVTPKEAPMVLSGNGLEWNYPWEGSDLDIVSGLQKTAYPTKVPNKRIACAMSHWLLWHKCIKEDSPLLILEHDAIFIEKLNYDLILKSNYEIVGINDPRMATRRAQDFYDKVINGESWIQPIPTIDEVTVPQGLAGNSAYIIKQSGAKKLLDAARKYGMWPNDALMCKQLISGLGVTKTFYTRVQGLPSTTVE